MPRLSRLALYLVAVLGLLLATGATSVSGVRAGTPSRWRSPRAIPTPTFTGTPPTVTPTGSPTTAPTRTPRPPTATVTGTPATNTPTPTPGGAGCWSLVSSPNPSAI